MMTIAAPLPRGRAYLGQGLSFPLRVTAHGRMATARAETKIEQSVWLIMASANGERIMRPDYGCGIHNMLFEPNSMSAQARLLDHVRRALSQQEPRITVLDVTADSSPADPSAVLIRVDYRIHENNSIASVVYPYFITEGM